MADKQLGLPKQQSWVWNLTQLDWWIGLLFMIGAAFFALGCVLYLGGVTHEFTMDAVFFTGSIFFTGAAYCQFHQAINAEPARRRWLDWQPRSITYWATLSQFIGTLLFNMNTFDAFFDLGWITRDVLVWGPDIFGSVLFQISGGLAMYEICRRWWCWDFHSLAWWINFINFLGCVAFLMSAVLVFVAPHPTSDLLATWSTVFTLIGACCFFIGAFLMWPEVALKQAKLSSRGCCRMALSR